MKRLLAIVAAAWSIGAAAHNFHAGITDISHNPNTGSVEVIHTYMLHDVDALLTNLYQRQFDLSNPDDEAVFRKYVEKQFYLLAKDTKRIPLNWVGIKLNADSVVIFREAEKTPMSAVARVHDAVLVDFFVDQQNTVNLKPNGVARTLNFSRAAHELPID